MNIIRSHTADSLYFWIEEKSEGNTLPAYESHEAYEIYILYSGERNMYLGSTLYHIRTGDAVMIGSETPHRSFGSTPYKGVCIEFSERYIENAFDGDAYRLAKACFEKKVIALDETALANIYEYTVRAKENESERDSCLFKILRELYGACRDSGFGGEFSNDSDLSNISGYIQKNYLTINGLDELAERFGLSKSHLCRTFKEHTGVTVTQYINALRMQYAYQLIIETKTPIKEVYRLCGYSNSQYFNRVFKKLRGCTPSAARREARETRMWEYEE